MTDTLTHAPAGWAFFGLANTAENSRADIIACRAALARAVEKWCGLAAPGHGEENRRVYDVLTRMCVYAPDAETLLAAAAELLAVARDDEGTNQPRASVRLGDNGVVTLCWSGTWTEGRHVTIAVEFAGGDAPVVHVPHKIGDAKARYLPPHVGGRMEWDTGKPSTFLPWIDGLIGDAADSGAAE
ncbi:hypothetical protein [Zavarzinella formosa]|uniref:hypothetical protein n=1 Tax=Zavarzinella formosa TaxID=360055 RepID=UPI0002EAEAE7|nr:hypothetical protein [Zavarzinella formosa]